MNQASQEKKVPVAVTNGASPVQALQDEMNNLFHSFFGESLPYLWRTPEVYEPFSLRPATDVAETDKEFKVTAELPGMDAKDITVTINEGCVTIKGKKEEESKEEANGYVRQERSFGEFQRMVALPPNLANVEQAEASMNKGVLTITVPKKADSQSKTRKLDVKQAA
ncbi:MAG: Hsp20/alpha crystallin family protein [Alphaproteobacteria bacterium]